MTRSLRSNGVVCSIVSDGSTTCLYRSAYPLFGVEKSRSTVGPTNDTLKSASCRVMETGVSSAWEASVQLRLHDVRRQEACAVALRNDSELNGTRIVGAPSKRQRLWS